MPAEYFDTLAHLPLPEQPAGPKGCGPRVGHLDLTPSGHYFCSEAYWPPPVRGKDRVHPVDLLTIMVLTNLLFARRQRTPGSSKGGSSCPIVTCRSVPISISSSTRRRICSARSGAAIASPSRS